MISATQALPATMPSAIADVIRERQRQLTEERALPALDDQHTELQLARAAAAYALYAPMQTGNIDAGRWPGPDNNSAEGIIVNALWPDDFTGFKPADDRRNCVRAAALLLAEIERLDRLAARSAT